MLSGPDKQARRLMEDHVDDPMVEVALEEYKTLRQEILNSITTQHAVPSLGALALGLLAGAAARVDSSLLAVVAIAGLGAPLLCLVVLGIWLNEVTRMLRAGLFLIGVEERLNDRLRRIDEKGWALPQTPLTWESRAHEQDKPDVERTHLTLLSALFGTVAATFAAYAMQALFSSDLHQVWKAVAATAETALLSNGLRIILLIRQQYQAERSKWEVRAEGQAVLEAYEKASADNGPTLVTLLPDLRPLPGDTWRYWFLSRSEASLETPPGSYL